jgi:hypothetical protein
MGASMSVRAVVGVISLCAVAIGGFAGNMFLLRMAEEINRGKPDGERIELFEYKFKFTFDRLEKWRRVESEYRRLYPNGRLRKSMRISLGFAIAGFITLITLAVFGMNSHP